MRESTFQKNLIKELKELFEGCIVLKLNANYKQGIPDLLVLWKDKWATLECKASGSSSTRPNQPYYVELMDRMSFSRIIFPENKEEVLNELQQSFKVGGTARVPRSK